MATIYCQKKKNTSRSILQINSNEYFFLGAMMERLKAMHARGSEGEDDVSSSDPANGETTCSFLPPSGMRMIIIMLILKLPLCECCSFSLMLALRTLCIRNTAILLVASKSRCITLGSADGRQRHAC